MSGETRIDPAPDNQHADWELQINALLDGELEDQQVAALLALAAREPVLESKLQQARLLQEALYRLPTQQAPRSLRDKLEQIIQAEEQSILTSWWRWGAAAAAVALLLLFNINTHQQGPSAAEIEQGHKDLAVALGYLQGASHKAAVEIDGSLIGQIVEPIKENTVRALSSQLATIEEFSL